MQLGLFDPETSTSSSEELPVSPSASPASVEDFPIRAEDSCSPILRSLGVSGLDGLSGRMCPESCQADEDGTLVPSSGRWGNWGMGGPTGSWTLNGSEHNGTHAPSRSDGGVSSLSDVLETGELPPRFSLSAKACAGILRRAQRRGKELPTMLRQALEQVAGQHPSPAPSIIHSEKNSA